MGLGSISCLDPLSLPSPSLPDPFVPTPSFPLDLFAPPRIEIGFLSGFFFSFLRFFCFLQLSFLFPVVFWVLCAPVWVFRLSAFRSPPPEVGPLHAPAASFSHRHLLQRCSGQIAPEPSPVDRSTFVIVFFGFPVFCFLCIIFSLIFLCILLLLGFPVFALIFPCFTSFCLFCVFFGFLQFCRSSPHLFCLSPSTARPFFAPHRVELPTHPSVYRVCLHAISFYFPIFLLFFACNKSYLDRPTFGCDAWSRFLGCGCEYYPDFRIEEDKCWPEVFSS